MSIYERSVCRVPLSRTSQVLLVVKNLPVNVGDERVLIWCLGLEDPLEEEMATRSSILAERIPWTEDWWATVQGVAKSWTWLSVCAQHIE